MCVCYRNVGKKSVKNLCEDWVLGYDVLTFDDASVYLIIVHGYVE